jgi:hypothetical protein
MKPSPLIAYRDYFRAGAWAGGFGEVPGLDIKPLDLVLTQQLGRPWKAQHGFGDRVLVRSFGASYPIDIVALLDVRPEGPLSVRVAYSPGIVIQPTTPIIQYATTEFTRNMYFVLPARLNLSDLVVAFTASPGTKYSVGRIWAGPVYRPPAGIAFDWSTRIVDAGTVRRTKGKQGYSSRGEHIRQLTMRIGGLSFEDSYGRTDNTVVDLQQVGMILGTTQPCIAMPRTMDANGSLNLQAIHRLGVYGHLPNGIQQSHRGGDLHDGGTVDVLELL